MFLSLCRHFDQQYRCRPEIIHNAFYMPHPPLVGYRPKVNAQDTIGELCRNIGVDRGIVFSAVANQDKLQVRVCVQQVDDLLLLVWLFLSRHLLENAVEAPQKDRPFWKAVVVEENTEVTVHVPRTVAQVEHRVFFFAFKRPCEASGIVRELLPAESCDKHLQKGNSAGLSISGKMSRPCPGSCRQYR